jgi:cephalosporin hydroxylase
VAELQLYAKLVSTECYLLVLDTVIDDLEVDPERSWGPGRSPKSAVKEYMSRQPGLFEPVWEPEARSALSVAPNGYWKRISP